MVRVHFTSCWAHSFALFLFLVVRSFLEFTMSVSHSPQSASQLTPTLVWLGFKQLLPISLFVVAFGMAFGLAATQKGFSDASIYLMSASVFAGAAQFAALDIWTDQLPLAALLMTVFAINARHLLMGASLYPWLSQLPPVKRYGVMLVASDANWAMAMQALNFGKPGLGLLFGGGLALWSAWLIGTWLGVVFGSAIADPSALGLDVVLPCFLLTMVVGAKTDLRMAAIWAAAAGVSLFAFYFLPDNTHVVLGAIAGGLVGVVWPEKSNEH